MTALFSTPKASAPTTANAAPPTRAASDVQAEVTSDRMRRALMQGRGRTIMTMDDVPAGDRRKTLLGE